MSAYKEEFSHSFTLGERDRRWRKTRELMQARGLEALVVIGTRHSEPLDRYLSNWVPGNTVVFPSEGEPTLLSSMAPEMFALGPDTPEEERPWIEDIRPGARGSIIAATLKEKGIEKGPVGVAGIGGLRTDWEGWVPFKTWNRVLSKMPNCSFEDVTDAFAELMLVKSDEELALVRRGAEILEEASREMVKAVAPGVSERTVYARYVSVLLEKGGYTPFQIMRSGPNTVSWGQPPWLFNVGAPRILEPGDVVLAEIFASIGGVETQVQMAAAIPPVPPVVSECADLARMAYEEGLRNLRPGKTFAEVTAAMDKAIERPDVWYLTPLIHNMNPMFCISATGVRIESMPGIEAYRGVRPSRMRGGEVVLRPGMVFEFEPNACIGRNRVNIGGTVIVTEDEPEVLNDFPTRMRVSGEAQQ